MAALLFHAHLGLPGGFVSIDVFFVLSGFLITGLLLRDLNDVGRVRLARFYTRRALRLLPAAVLVTVAVVGISWLLLDPLSARAAASDGGWASVYVANIRFVLEELDYFGAPLASSPFLHYWSLSVEEQFYGVWPLLIAGAALLRLRWAFPALLLVLGAASFVHAEVLVDQSRTAAYYSTLTRVWEFAAGAAGAFAVHHWPERRPAPGRSWAVLGAALIAVPLALYDASTPSPGLSTVPVVIGTVLLLLPGAFRTDSPFPRLTDSRLVQRFGDISYSLYLWHWPLLVWLEHELPNPSPAARGGTLLVAVVLAELTYRFVEDPARRWRPAPAKNTAIIPLGGVAASLLLASTAAALIAAVPVSSSGTPVSPSPITSTAGLHDALTDAVERPGPVPSNLTPTLEEAGSVRPLTYGDGCHNTPLTEGVIDRCTYGEGLKRPIVLVGDSLAAHWFPALRAIAPVVDRPLVNLTLSGCPILDLPVYLSDATEAWDECTQRQEAIHQHLDRLEPGVIIVVNSDKYELPASVTEPAPREADLPDDRTARHLAGLRRALTRITTDSPDARVIVLGPSPFGARDDLSPRTPTCLAAYPDDAGRCVATRDDAASPRFLAKHSGAALASGADMWVDTTPFFCARRGCPAVIGSTMVTYDAIHMTPSYSEMVAPALLEQLRRVLT